MSEQKNLNPYNILLDPRVDGQYVDDRWGARVPFFARSCITSDLTDYEEIEKKGGININCKFYKPVAIKQDCVFHHYSPEWILKMQEGPSGNDVVVRYTMKKFYIGNQGFENELRENRTKME